MPSNKNLIHLAILLSVIVAMAPFPRALAQSGSEIAVTNCVLANACRGTVTTPATTFKANITLANVPSLVGFDIIVNYNPSVLTTVSVAMGNAFAGKLVVTLANETTQSTGTIHVAEVILGSDAAVTNSSLIVVTYAFTGFGVSPITISSIFLTGLVSGVVVLLPTPTIVNGTASTPPAATATLTKWKARPDIKNIGIGSTQTLFANVLNTGTGVAFVRVDFIVTSSSGSVTPESTAVTSLPTTGTAVVSVSYTVTGLPSGYFVQARLMVSGDGLLFVFSGATKTFSFKSS